MPTRILPTGDDHQVTTLELLSDLVSVDGRMTRGIRHGEQA